MEDQMTQAPRLEWHSATSVDVQAIAHADRTRLREFALTSPAFQISIRLLYKGIERDYVINGRKSLRDLRIRWHKHLEKVFAEIPAGTLQTQQISSYVTARLAQGAAKATVNRELSALKRMYKLAVREGALKLADIPFFAMLREKNTRSGFLKDEKYADLARATSAIGLWLRVLFELGYNYGWRKGELLGLRVNQVDLVERTIVLHAGETKTDAPRLVEMTRTVYELLRVLLAGKAPEDKVFTRRRGKPVEGFRRAWHCATKNAGVPGLLFHDLRRSAIRNMVRAGVTEKVAMTISGHKTRNVFERYNIISQSDLHRAVAIMDLAAFNRGYEALPCDEDDERQASLPFEDAAVAAPRKPAASADIQPTAAQYRGLRDKA
jgi:integrase